MLVCELTHARPVIYMVVDSDCVGVRDGEEALLSEKTQTHCEQTQTCAWWGSGEQLHKDVALSRQRMKGICHLRDLKAGPACPCPVSLRCCCSNVRSETFPHAHCCILEMKRRPWHTVSLRDMS